ncbi:MAG: VWA domain-containing protein [Candidatus Omnitrophica bacterium]|nr:VWA domain-containing protein [Candidatus Omnitrophota bacterium]
MKRILILILALHLFFPVWVYSGNIYKDNLIIIMDCSGSMGGSKLREAKTALKEILKHIPESTHIGLLAFGGKYHGWRYQLGPRDDNKLLHAIDQLNAGGETPLGEFMRYGAEKLLEQKDKQLGYGNYRLLVITDGEATDQTSVTRYTPDIMAKGITIDLIGVYMKQKHSLSRMVHSYREANNTSSLKKAISEVLAEIGDKSHQQATQDAFEIISGLPDDLTMNIIGAITSTTEHPIGDNSRPASMQDMNKYQKKRHSSQTRSKNTSRSFMDQSMIVFGVVAVITIFLLRAMKTK